LQILLNQNLKYKVYIEKVIFTEILNVHEVQFHKYFSILFVTSFNPKLNTILEQ